MRHDLSDTRLVALFLDATFISVRPSRSKKGVLVAWGFSEDGERLLLAVMLAMRESYEDWQALGRDLIARGLGAPMLIVADGATGSTKRSSSAGRRPIASAACTALATSTRRARANASSAPTGRRSMTRSTSATASNDSTRSSPSATRVASPPQRSARPTIWTRSSCT
jgi:transposase-like protein